MFIVTFSTQTRLHHSSARSQGLYSRGVKRWQPAGQVPVAAGQGLHATSVGRSRSRGQQMPRPGLLAPTSAEPGGHCPLETSWSRDPSPPRTLKILP